MAIHHIDPDKEADILKALLCNSKLMQDPLCSL
jgi:hypothetical protein